MNKDLDHRWLVVKLDEMKNYARENEIKVEWTEPGDVLIEAAHLTGLSEALEIISKAPSIIGIS